MSISRHAGCLLLALIEIAPCGARAGEFPLWEAGAGIAVIDFPDYRGSDERQSYILPVPYFVYRGEILKADREGLRGQFFKNDRLDLHLSLNGTVPVDSTDNTARRLTMVSPACARASPACWLKCPRMLAVPEM